MHKILIIEDDARLRYALCALLRRGGYLPVEAADGQDGVAKLRQEEVVMVITDMVMPRQEGLETIRQIRELDPTLPILAMSGVHDTDYSPLRLASSFGAQVLEKPFTGDDLLQAISVALRGTLGDADSAGSAESG